MPYSSQAVANYFIDLGRRDSKPLSPLKLQKLVYFAHGWYLALTGEPLLNEQIEAWQYGPVVPSLFWDFREFGSESIDRPATTIEVGNGDFLVEVKTPRIEDEVGDHEPAKSILNRVWDSYGQFTAVQLSNMTHKSGTPWSDVVTQHHFHPPRGTDIPGELIKSHFESLLEGSRA